MENAGIGSWIRKRAEKSADSAAIVFRDSVTTYRQFDARINQLSAVLRSHGVEVGSRVAYLGDNHPSFLETLFATATLGAIFVPLNTRLAPAELRYAVEDAASDVLIHSELLAEKAVLGGGARLIEFGADLDALIAKADPTRIDVPVGLDNTAIIMYTSGTSGRPKGAMLTHGNLTWNAINVLVDYDLTSSDRALMISPLFHAASLGMGALPAFLKGATVVLEPSFDAGTALRQIENHRITWISGVPTTFQMLSEHPAWAATDLSSLRSLTCGGSPVPLRVLEAFERRGLAFTGGYGMTESSPGATSLQPAESRHKAGSAGIPHFFTDLRVVDPMGMEVATGTIGEIQLRGPNVLHSYWNRPEDSAASFDIGGWFRTGDLGYLDEEGYLYIADRLKDMIISGGENIYPAEVEQVILGIPGITAAAVLGIPDDRWGEVPIAVVTTVTEAEVDTESVRAALEPLLARFKIPKRVIVVDELPRTASGKVRKSDLRRNLVR